MRAYYASVWSHRYFWMALVRNDLLRRYRNSILGVAWSLISPLASTFVLCAVFQEIFHRPAHEYGPLLLASLAFWTYFTRSILEGCECYIVSENYIRQHPLPMGIYPLRTTLGAFIHFMIALAVVLPMVWLFKGFGNLSALIYLIPALEIIFFFTLATATLAGLMNTVFRDTKYILEILFQMLFYLTPIIYPADLLLKSRVGWIIQYNPIVPLLDIFRQPLLEGTPPTFECMAAAVLITTIMMVAAAATLPFQQRRVVFYL